MAERISAEEAAAPGAPGAGPRTGGGWPVRPRRAIVLGAGGVLGFAWLLGALAAVEQTAGFDLREVDLIVGTSAGSVGAALLSCGLGVDVISRHHQGVPVPGDPELAYDHDRGAGGVLPPRPGWRPASPRLVVDSLRHPRRVPPIVGLAGLLPVGRATLQPVRDMVATVAADAGLAEEWPRRPRPWIVAVDYRSGRRVVFGRDPGRRAGEAERPARTARLAEAVSASCSIPGWYPPTVIGGVTYIDGGAASNASVDLLVDAPVDEVYVLAPMASVEPDRPSGALGRVERTFRRAVTRRLLADVARVRASGKRVRVVTPGPPDLAEIGLNLMDPARRTAVLDMARMSAAAQLRRQGVGSDSSPAGSRHLREGRPA